MRSIINYDTPYTPKRIINRTIVSRGGQLRAGTYAYAIAASFWRVKTLFPVQPYAHAMAPAKQFKGARRRHMQCVCIHDNRYHSSVTVPSLKASMVISLPPAPYNRSAFHSLTTCFSRHPFESQERVPSLPSPFIRCHSSNFD